jgi:hypothetical protein
MITLKRVNIENAEKYLDQRWSFIRGEDDKPNRIAYRYCVETLEYLGLGWERDENGKHVIFDESNNYTFTGDIEDMEPELAKEHLIQLAKEG